MIPQKELITEYLKIQKIVQKNKLKVPFFDFVTAMGFDYFRSKKIDVGVIEVGIGGKLDATNIVDPILSVITSIGYDHTNFLGNTLEEISENKAGIIKKGRPVVIGEGVPDNGNIREIFRDKAQEMNSEIFENNNINNNNNKKISFDQENNNTVLKAIDILKKYYPSKYGDKITQKAIEIGLSKTPKCRMEKVFSTQKNLKKKLQGKISEIILDVGHNPHGFQRMIDSVKTEYKNKEKKIRIACAFSYGKNINEMLQICVKENVKVNFLRSGHRRVMEFDKMIKAARGKDKNNDVFLDLKNKKYNGDLKEIIRSCENEEILVICGTFFIMKEARKILGFKDVSDPENVVGDVVPNFINRH